MLFHLNYQFLSNKSWKNTKTAVPTITANTLLQPPKSKGPIDHVAFVIHGIGQQTERFGFFQSHLQSLYNTTNQAVEENLPGKEINVHYVPIEWHKHIHEETDTAMNDITLQSIPFLRMVNNDYLADAFFYLSKERGQSIINHVTREFNEAYARFLKEYPLFDGKVAILAYSLGGIITWDILANNYGVTPKNEINSKLDFLFPTLNFKPDFFFTLGSPLSAFLTVRNQDPKVYRPDASILFENIFHPFDPLAYRFEPMLNSYYKNKPAVLIDAYRDAATFFSDDHILQRVYNKGLKWMTCISKIFVSQQEASYSEDELSTPKLSLDYYSDEEEDEEIKTPCDLLVSNENLFISQKRRSIDVEWQEEMMMNKRQKKMNDTEKLLLSTTMTRNATMIAAEEFNVLENRVDYVLRPERCLLGLVNKNGYLSGLTAHFSYWTHPDLMWHIVRRLEYGKRK